MGESPDAGIPFQAHVLDLRGYRAVMQPFTVRSSTHVTHFLTST
jgi:hypothetical protein